MLKKTKSHAVAFVCLRAYPFFDKSVSSRVGGMETRSALFARSVASRHNWTVEFLVGNYGQAHICRIEEILFRTYRPIIHPAEKNIASRFSKYGWWRPVMHLDRRDLDLFWQLPIFIFTRIVPRFIMNLFWRKISPEIVCCFGNNSITAEVIADCFRSSIKTVLCIASDDDLSADYTPTDRHLNDYGTPRWKAWYAIVHADRIFVQTEHQRALLRKNFGREGDLIRNPVVVASDSRGQWPDRRSRNCVLWIGRSDSFNKRPLLLIELAQGCPDIDFVMIVNRTDPKVFDTLQCERPENVTLIEHVPHHEIWNYYRRARVFVSTSAYEGFPNTFLQAAVSGVPVASLNVDPEGILTDHRCGAFAAGDLGELARLVRELWTSDSIAEEYASTFFDFAIRNHGLDEQARQFEALLDDMKGKPALRDRYPQRLNPFKRFVKRPDLG